MTVKRTAIAATILLSTSTTLYAWTAHPKTVVLQRGLNGYDGVIDNYLSHGRNTYGLYNLGKAILGRTLSSQRAQRQ